MITPYVAECLTCCGRHGCSGQHVSGDGDGDECYPLPLTRKESRKHREAQPDHDIRALLARIEGES